MADNHRNELESVHARSAESFEITYWADRFGVTADQVREAISELDSGSLDDSMLERFC